MEAMISRPRYRALEPAPACRRHILVVEGAALAAPLAADVRRRFAGLGPTLHLLVAGGASPGLAAGTEQAFATPEQAVAALAAALDGAAADWRLYALGTEPLLWAVALAARARGLAPGQVQLCHAGSGVRSVWCAHCHHVTGGVHTNLVRCDGCARCLLVRDHFSRRLGAFMGIQADAEAAGALPPVQRIYP